jgi:hypothetical protein
MLDGLASEAMEKNFSVLVRDSSGCMGNHLLHASMRQAAPA